MLHNAADLALVASYRKLLVASVVLRARGSHGGTRSTRDSRESCDGPHRGQDLVALHVVQQPGLELSGWVIRVIRVGEGRHCKIHG